MNPFRRALHIAVFAICVVVCMTGARAQVFPDTVYAWKKTTELFPLKEDWKSSLGERAEIFESFGASEVRIATYSRQGKSARIDVVLLPSSERAFGLFRTMAEGSAAQGIIGDAFAYERAAVHVNFGPFYFRVAAEEKRATQPPDEALVVRTRRLLFARADCYGSDFPLPSDERVLGSERYFPPDARAWRPLRSQVPEGLLPVLSTHAAFSAEYEKGRVGVRRLLLFFPFRQKEAAAAFAAELVQQLELRMGSRSDACALPTFFQGGLQRVVAADGGHVFFILSDASDAGCCEWARGLLRR
ncbi:MAG: hypothetical protein IH600_08595 [Bacteroidetes bacterium]|nr:hypothetical protein [Bacteroidota bacterium]